MENDCDSTLKEIFQMAPTNMFKDVDQQKTNGELIPVR